MHRLFGRIILALGFAALGLALFGVGPSIARLWAQLHSNSLVGLQGFVDQNLDPDPGDPTVWFDTVLPVLTSSIFYPVAVIFCVIGLVSLLSNRSSR